MHCTHYTHYTHYTHCTHYTHYTHSPPYTHYTLLYTLYTLYTLDTSVYVTVYDALDATATIASSIRLFPNVSNILIESTSTLLLFMEERLADKYAEGIFNQIKDEIKNIKHDEGGLNSGNLWRLKNKLNKKYPEPPTAMKDDTGNLLTEKKDILEHTVKYYENVLRLSSEMFWERLDICRKIIWS